jgi:hypothetical protein
MKRMTMAAVAALVTATWAQAQEGGLTEDQVRGFFDDMQTQMEQAVADGEWKGIQSWMGAHLAEGASLAFQGAINMRNGPVVSYAATFSGDALRHHVEGPDMMGHQRMIEALEDYTLAVEVEAVTPLPNGESSAQVSFIESGTFVPPEAGGEATTVEGAANDGTTFVSISDCDLRLSDSGGEPRIEVASCMTSTTL